MTIAIAALIMLQTMGAATAPALPASVYTESTQPGRVVSGTDAVGLCSTDETGAARDMERLAVATLLPKSRVLPVCTARVEGDWKVVRGIADRCLPGPDRSWCEVEAHAVLIERGGRRQYAVILVTADQLN